MQHRRAVYGRLGLRQRARLRVGVPPELLALGKVPDLRTGHGAVWGHVLAEMRRLEYVRLVGRGRADVWLGDGHSLPPTGRPLVVQLHEAGWRDPELRRFLDPRFASGIDLTTTAAVAAADQLITPSAAAREQVIEAFRVPPERVHAVPHGVDHMVFRPGLPGGREMVGAPYVLIVAILHPRKNLEAARRAVADLAAAGRPHRLAIVAGSPADSRSNELAREATADLPGQPGRVVCFRELPADRLAALMAGADCFCLPSHFEGFGIPALEALACGAPVVVSDRGALPEVVGDAGLIVSPDPEEVSRAVRSLVADAELARRLAAAGPRRAAGFSWARTAEGWVEILRAAA